MTGARPGGGVLNRAPGAPSLSENQRRVLSGLWADNAVLLVARHKVDRAESEHSAYTGTEGTDYERDEKRLVPSERRLLGETFNACHERAEERDGECDEQ